MAFHDHFSSRAAQYASSRPTYPFALSEHLATLVPVGSTIWEAGCGSGQLTRDVAKLFPTVFATDPSVQQLSKAPPFDSVCYYAATAEDSGLRSASVNLCVAAQAAHWFDSDRYYAEVRRVTKRGGVIALMSYGNSQIDPALDPVTDAFHHFLLDGYWPPERRHVDFNYETLPFPFEPIAAPKLWMDMHWTRDQYFGYVGTWSAVKALRDAGREEKLEEFIEEVSSIWRDADERKSVRWPLALKIGRVG